MRFKSITVLLMTSMMVVALAGCKTASTGTDGEASDISTSSIMNESGVEVAEDSEKGEGAEASADSNSAEVSEDPEGESASDGSDISASDDAFVYNGRTVSIIDDVSTIFANLGNPEVDKSRNGNGCYLYDNEELKFSTCGIDAEATPSDIAITDKDIVTARSIGIGNTKEEVMKAYSDMEIPPMDDGDVVCCQFKDFIIKFDFDSNSTVTGIRYINDQLEEEG